MTTADFDICNHGSIITIRPMNEHAQAWWDDNVDPEAMSIGGAYAVEPRYAHDIVEGFADEGFTFQ